MLLIITIICLAFKAQASEIIFDGGNTAKYGEEAIFTCTLPDPKGVLQVTWQRGLKPESLENLATYSNRFGKQVNEPFNEKVSFRESTLNMSSIILKNITWEDENCYVCSFNAYPDGSKRKQMCLTVTGVLEFTSAQQSSVLREQKIRKELLSCSATGKPAPTITWEIPINISKNAVPQKTTDRKSDGTFIHNTSIAVDIPAIWTGHIDCVLNKGQPGEQRKTFDFSSIEQEEGNQSQIILIIAVLLIIICIAVVIVLIVHKRSSKRRSNNDQTIV
ncbi:PREDICTED: OX-2 membrane glycoprotein-like [Cyprinodon variegatus]|uniref:OX-2 membrane glycoprotein-like n=1 Tax=Cyprinodon variegatus TaxID=28743 RepID=UPI000742844E|nr:PREDICTED: OX-2 membrane glycoprotein-like [Cyprinodon variegatus]